MVVISVDSNKNAVNETIQKYGCKSIFTIASSYDKLNRLVYKEIMIFEDKMLIDKQNYIYFKNIISAKASVTKHIVKMRGNSMYINPHREATTYLLHITFRNKYGSEDTLFFGCESYLEYTKYKQLESIINSKVGYIYLPSDNNIEEL